MRAGVLKLLPCLSHVLGGNAAPTISSSCSAPSPPSYSSLASKPLREEENLLHHSNEVSVSALPLPPLLRNCLSLVAASAPFALLGYLTGESPKQRPQLKATKTTSDVEEFASIPEKKVLEIEKCTSPLAGFVVEKVVKNNPGQKKFTLLGKFPGRDSKSVVTVEKSHFAEEELAAVVDGARDLRVVTQNADIAYFVGSTARPQPLKVSVIHGFDPKKHLQFYDESNIITYRESSQVYKRVTKEYIDSMPRSRLQWIRNLFSGEAVEEEVFSQVDGDYSYVIIADAKWEDRENLKKLHLLAICEDENIRTLRDLRGEHIPMLKHMRAEALRVLESKFGVPENEVQMFVHYQPSFYQFHVHFTHISAASEEKLDRSRLLDDIIQNLQLDSNYYARSTLSFPLNRTSALYKRLRRFGCVG